MIQTVGAAPWRTRQGAAPGRGVGHLPGPSRSPISAGKLGGELNTAFKRTSASRRVSTALAFILGAPTFAASSCGEDAARRIMVEPLLLTPVSTTVMLMPGATARVAFLLKTTSEQPVAGERLDLSAVDNPQTPANDLAGATLSASSALTDADGIGAVTVTAGLRTMFQVTARQARAGAATATVVVGDVAQGTLAVVSTPVAGSKAASVVTTVDVLLFDNQSCFTLSPLMPPIPVLPMQTVAPGVPAEFAIDSLMVERAVVGRGRDRDGALRALGCMNVPSSTIVPGSAVRVYLSLSDLTPVPRGSFLLSSRFSLARRDITQRVAAPWRDLGDCPLDPGQIWLDCAIDALGSAADDPLDCVPSPSGEGDLANLIAARRADAPVGSFCRATMLGAGVQGLDARVAALFPSPAQPPANDVDILGGAIASMFDDVRLESTLSLDATAIPGMFLGTHTLRSAVFQVGTQATTVDIVAQGTPNAQVRLVPVTTNGDTLAIDAHGLGLHIGTLAHAAFAQVALSARGLPTSTPAYLDVLFGLASSGTGTTRIVGCEALDGLVCADVGRGAGCLRAACTAGQVALAQRLDGGFTLADGDGADLLLSGSATMTDDNGDGFADGLGSVPANSGDWTAQIRARAGTESLSATWNGLSLP
jgi:hypothetical protein